MIKHPDEQSYEQLLTQIQAKLDYSIMDYNPERFWKEVGVCHSGEVELPVWVGDEQLEMFPNYQG